MNRITLAPTTLPDTPPLEFIQAAVSAGFDGLGFRLHKSPAYPNWVDWLGDAALKREVKRALADSGQEMVESLSYYLLPEMDLEEMKPVARIRRRAGRHLRAGHRPRRRLVAPARQSSAASATSPPNTA